MEQFWLRGDGKGVVFLPAATVAEPREFLESQWPEQAPMTPEEQEPVTREFTRLLDKMRNRPIDHEAIGRQMREQRNRMAAMLAFLDQ